MDRKEKAFAYIDLSGRGLEIGASHSPLLPKSSGARIQVVDHAERAELVDKYLALGIPPEMTARIEEVDFVWSEGRLADAVGERHAFDYILGSHIVEHMVDLIGFLQDCAALLGENGRLSLLVPDKRYCFDLLKPLTSLGVVVNSHVAATQFHPYGTALDHRAYECTRGGEIAWDDTATAPIALKFGDLIGGDPDLEKAFLQEEYVDNHRWTFTPTSFRLLLQDLRELGYLDLMEVGGFDTAGSEFFVTLGHSDGSPPKEDRLAMLLRIDMELRSAVEQVVPASEMARLRAESAMAIEQQRASAAEAERLRLALADAEATLGMVTRSASWRLTAPLRAVMGALRGIRRA